MPLYYGYYEDFLQHRERLDIPKAAQRLTIPMLIIHGTAIPAVPVEAAHQLHAWNRSSRLLLIEGADHVFGAAHPWPHDHLPDQVEEMLAAAVGFFRS